MINQKERQSQILALLADGCTRTISDIVRIFDDTISRKTIQRDLKKLIENNVVSQSGAGRGVVYFLAEQNTIFAPTDIEKYFAIDYGRREVKSFNFDIFRLLEGDVFTLAEREKMEELQRRFVKNFSSYDSQTLINKEFERMMIEFSWKSSAVEGNTYSLLATEALIQEGIEGKGKTKEETQMILNHKDAFNETIQNKDRFKVLNLSDIEYIHSVLTKHLGITRNIRNGAVGITGTKYKPLNNAHQIIEALQKMITLINTKEHFWEKAFLALVLTSYIQAFEDGNKRLARMLSNAILLAHNSAPLSYRAVSVEEYKKASLLFYEINNLTYFKQIFVDQFEDAVNNYFN